MGVCCGKVDPKVDKKDEAPPKQDSKPVPVIPPQNSPVDPTATQTGGMGGYDKTILTDSYMKEIGGGHIFGPPGAPISIHDKVKEKASPNYPPPPVPQKVLPNPKDMPEIDRRNTDLHRTPINIYNGAVPPAPNNPTSEAPDPNKIPVSPPANVKQPKPVGPTVADQLQVIPEGDEAIKTISVISKIHVDNLPHQPSVAELKFVPNVLPDINKAHFQFVTSRIVLLNPSTLNIDLPQGAAYVRSIRPLPSVGEGAFEFISCNQVFTTGLDQKSAARGVSKPDGKFGLSRFPDMVQLPATFQAHDGRVHQGLTCVGLPQKR